jgi:hypothetical protein
MAGHMVDVLVTGHRLAYPRVAPIVAAQESRDLGRHQHTVAGHVRVARRAGTRRVRQVPVLVPGNQRDALELLPALAAVPLPDLQRRCTSRRRTTSRAWYITSSLSAVSSSKCTWFMRLMKTVPAAAPDDSSSDECF